MTQEMINSIAQEAIKILLTVSMPLLVVALVVGLVVALFQAVTQLQEMTLAFIPKIIAVFAVLLLTFPWMLNLMMDFTKNILINIPTYISY
ncbi:MAG: flagellar biosynthesis protein FliQ [Proteobacteria bacterium]|nr:flagellar biosynthesis protein FliQ [Pseudomonadota bacterium]